jgi:hypothetical protein
VPESNEMVGKKYIWLNTIGGDAWGITRLSPVT